MPGFIDVSHMSDREIQRLGHADDVDEPRVRRGQTRAEDRVIPANLVWAAAAHAHRINGGDYLKEPEYAKDEQGYPDFKVVLRQPNRTVMNQAMTNPDLITDEDRGLGTRAMTWHQQNMLFKTLKGNLEGFEAALSTTVGLREFKSRTHSVNISIVASQIRSYEQAKQMSEVMEGISSEPVAPVGNKVSADITVVKSIFSKNYNVYFITAVTTDRRAVFFSYRERLSLGHQCRIHGTVKAHRENSTQLNRVKVL